MSKPHNMEAFSYKQIVRNELVSMCKAFKFKEPLISIKEDGVENDHVDEISIDVSYNPELKPQQLAKILFVKYLSFRLVKVPGEESEIAPFLASLL